MDKYLSHLTVKDSGTVAIPSKYPDEEYSLGVSDEGSDITLEMYGASMGAGKSMLFVKHEDLAKGLSDALGWTIITEPLPTPEGPDHDGDYLNPLSDTYVGPKQGDTAESVRRAALELLAIAQRLEKGESEAVSNLTFLLDEAGKGAKDNVDLARNLLKAGVKAPSI